MVLKGVLFFVFCFSVVLLPFCSTPLTMGLSLAGFSVVVVFGIIFCESTWLAVLVGLVCVSGLSVLFLYFVATSLGNKPNLSGRWVGVVGLGVFIIWGSLVLLGGEFGSVSSSLVGVGSVCVFYLGDSVYVLCFLGLLLFFIMVGVVKLSSRSCGPLRGFY